MYNLCFMSRHPFNDFAPALYKEFRETYDKDAKGIFINCNGRENDYTWSKFEKDDPNVVTIDLSTFMNQHWDEFTLEKLQEYEEKYDAKPMWKYIYTDRFLIHHDRDYCIHTACGLFAFWEYVFTTYDVHFYYDEVVATLLTYTAYLVGQKTGAHYYSMLLMRSVGMDLTHHYFLNEPFEMAYGMEKDYLNVDYTKEELEKADAILKNFEEKNVKPAFITKYSGKKPTWKARFFILPFFYLRQRFFNPNTRDKGQYIYYKCYTRTCEQIKFFFRYQKSKNYYKAADMSKKYVYFPLHFQPEASTIVCAQKYEKQLYFLDSLAKSLPADTVIYAKEHYSFLGSREMSFYKALAEYPNIELINPWEDSIQLIRNCQCLATLTGTAGQEAMMLRKPVIMGGDILYKDGPGVMRIDDIYDNYLSAMENWKQPDREDVVKYMAAYIRCAKEGNTYVLSEDRLSKENMSKLAKSIFDYFNEIKTNN